MSEKIGSQEPGSPQWHRAEAEYLENQAKVHRDLARQINAQREEQQREANAKTPVDREAVQLVSGAPVPADGSHTEAKPNGQQRDYVVLTEAERGKGFVRPYRDAYRHVGRRPRYPTRPLTPDEETRFGGGDHPFVAFEPYPEDAGRTGKGRFWTKEQLERGCGQITTMGRSIAETYARDPGFYGGTFCATCGDHFPVGEYGEFTWCEADGREGPKVGT